MNNSAPVIDLDPDDSTVTTRTTFRTIFTENGTPTAIADTDTTITDLDSTTLVSATITLANQQAGDLLTVTLPLPGGIVASAYDPGTGVLTLTGVASLDDYEVALRQVLYSNDSDNPATVDRLIEVVVSDGVNTSNVAAAVITVVPVNDAPAVDRRSAAAYVENAATVALSPLAALTDLDDADLSQVVMRITGGAISGDGDTLTVGGLTGGTVNGITFLWDAAEHAMVLTGASSVLNYQNLLRTVGFHSTSDNPTDFGAERDADPDVERIGWHGGHDRNDDTRYPRRERCPAGDGRRNRVLYGERGAGRALAGVNRNRRRQHHSRFR